jgi:hypothetical protein
MRQVTTSRRRAQPSRCPNCKSNTITGTDDTGFTTTIDPTPITREAELHLYCANQRTYSVDKGTGELIYRDKWRLRTPATHTWREHHCGSTTPPHMTATIHTPIEFIPYPATPPF